MKVIYIVGLPRSGKSTIVKSLVKSENACILSSDAIRQELFGELQGRNRNVFLVL